MFDPFTVIPMTDDVSLSALVDAVLIDERTRIVAWMRRQDVTRTIESIANEIEQCDRASSTLVAPADSVVAVEPIDA